MEVRISTSVVVKGNCKSEMDIHERPFLSCLFGSLLLFFLLLARPC